MFLPKKSFFHFFIIVSFLEILPIVGFSQLKYGFTSTSFLTSKAGFKVSKGSVVIGDTLAISAIPTLSVSAQASIRYTIVGVLQSFDIKVATFACNGCPTSTNIVFPTFDGPAAVVQTKDLIVAFSEAGIYYIIQNFTDGSGYVNVERIIVYPNPVAEYQTCNCQTVYVSIPKVKENEFYEEIEVDFGTGDNYIVLRDEYGSKIVSNSIAYAGWTGFPAPCPDRGSFRINGKKSLPAPDKPFIHSPPVVNPILFNAKQDPINIGTTRDDYYVKEMSHEKNDDVNISFNLPIKTIEVSEDGGNTWSNLPSSNFTFTNAGLNFKVSGYPINPTKEVCFRGNIPPSNCGYLLEVRKPKACVTGEIKSITDEIGSNSGQRDVVMELITKKTDVNSGVVVIRNVGKPDEKSISSSSLQYVDAAAPCTALTYRTKTTILPSVPGRQNTIILAKPVSYQLTATNLTALSGVSTVTVKSAGTAANAQTVDISYISGSGNRKFNYYRTENGLANLTKLNAMPSVSTFFNDNSALNSLNTYCYSIKYIDQCGFESPPTLPICTVLLTSKKVGSVEWTLGEVATSGTTAAPYAPINGFTLQEAICNGGTCNIGQSFPDGNVTNTTRSYDMDLTDINPETKHQIDVRILVKTTPFYSIFSNIITYFYPAKLFIPSIFTPNGDGINDELITNGLHVKEFKMAIYDRWGVKIVELGKIGSTLEKWNGKNENGDFFPEGMYSYRAEAVDYSGDVSRKITKEGNFLLMR